MNILIVPQYSMRSYKTGIYSLLADGNLNLVLHQIYRDSGSNTYTITVPQNIDYNELETVADIVGKFKANINFMPIPYGKNADENRVTVPSSMAGFDYSTYTMCISYIENLRPTIPWVLKMHMSKIKQLSRPYADKHFSNFLIALADSNMIWCDVLNFAQLDEVKKVRPNLADKINVNELCLNTDFYSVLITHFKDDNLIIKLSKLLPKGSYFFPFRISDKAYNFDKAKTLGTLVVTDPNESLSDGTILNLSKEFKDYDIKTILINTILAIKVYRSDVQIPIYEDCELAVHQLIIELCYMLPNNIVGMNSKKITERYTFR